MGKWQDPFDALENGAGLDDVLDLFGRDMDEPLDDGVTPLELMVHHRRFDLVAEAVRKGKVEPDAEVGSAPLLLVLASHPDSVDAVKALVDAGADPLEGGDTGTTPLHSAAAAGATEVVKVLLEHADIPDPVDEYGRTPLHFAAQVGRRDVVNLLLEAGSDPFTPDALGDTPLAMLLLSPDPEDRKIASQLLETIEEIPFSILALMASGNEELLRKFASHIDPRQRGPKGETLMHHVRRKGAAELLASMGVPVDAQDDEGATPLMRAIERETSLKLIRWFLDRGADVNARDNMRRTPLMYAADIGDPELVRFLLSRGADVSLRDDSRATALFHAAESEAPTAPEVIRILVEAGAKVNARGSRDETPLMAAVGARSLANVATLLELGADPSLKNTFGEGPMDRAQEMEFEEMMDLLENQGARSTYPASVHQVLNSVDELEALLEGMEYESGAFVLLYPQPFDPADPSRIGGAPIGITLDGWPRTEPWVLRFYEHALGEIDPSSPYMEHVLTVDLRDVEELPGDLPDDTGALSFFVARSVGGLLTGMVEDLGNSDDNPVYRVVPVSEQDLEEGLVLAEQPVRYPGSVRRRGLGMLLVEVPLAVRWASADEDTVNAIASGTIDDLESYLLDNVFPGDPDDDLHQDVVVPFVKSLVEHLSPRTLANAVAVLSDLRLDLLECSYLGPYPMYLDEPPEGYDEYDFVLQFGRDLVPEMAMPEDGIVYLYTTGAFHQSSPEDEDE